MKAAVLSVGSELLRGDITDTNSQFLARELTGIGCRVAVIQAVPDELEILTDALRKGVDLADVVVCTGGLGPTQDDLTREAIARVLGEAIYVDEGLVVGIRERFAALRRRMPESNRRQAQMIPSAASIENPNGTAPGWYVEKSGKVIVAMPGPPREMEPMWRQGVMPRLQKLFAGASAAGSLMTFGLGESAVEELVAPVISRGEDVVIATYAKSNGVQVHVTAQSDTQDTARRLVVKTLTELRERLGEAVFGEGEETLAQRIGSIVKARGLSIAVMESATGGEVANLITDVEGSSEYFLGGVVAYSRDVKAQYGVDVHLMNQYGTVSTQTAISMAVAIRQEMRADIGIGTTGVAGKAPLENRPPGTCFIAVDVRGNMATREIHRPGDRSTIKHFFAQCALDLLRRELEQNVTESA